MANLQLVAGLLVVLPLAVAAVHPDALRPFVDLGVTHYTMQYRLGSEDVKNLQAGFLALVLANSNKFLEGVAVGIKQTAVNDQPPEWVLVDLIAPEGDSDEVLSTVAFRSDNVYSVGVTNADNVWQCFAGVEHLTTGCQRLPFDSSYKQDGSGIIPRENLDTVEIGRAAMESAVHSFRGYGTASATPTTVDAMKLSFATVALVISEGARFKEIQELVRAGWETGARVQKPERFVFWSRITCAVAKDDAKEIAEIEKAFGLPAGAGKAAVASLVNFAIYSKKCEKELDSLP